MLFIWAGLWAVGLGLLAVIAHTQVEQIPHGSFTLLPIVALLLAGLLARLYWRLSRSSWRWALLGALAAALVGLAIGAAGFEGMTDERS
jgi:uncharacterized BrkB/YihY/UPF0761 family membrane protein